MWSGERRNLENAIESRINNKRSYAVSQLLGTMCAGEAYGMRGLASWRTWSARTSGAFLRITMKLLAHSRVEIFYMGRKTAADAAEAFREALKELPRGVCTAVGTSVVERAEAVREKVETMDVAQGKLAIGLRTGCTAADEGYPALLMMNAIFGGGATSKLFTKVREEMSLCYYAGSSVEKFKGVMLVSSGIETANYETAKKEILNQLEQCRAGNISDYEFDSAKRYILSEPEKRRRQPRTARRFLYRKRRRRTGRDAGRVGKEDRRHYKAGGRGGREAGDARHDLFSERRRRHESEKTFRLLASTILKRSCRTD